MSTNEGPLSKLLRATGHTEPLAPIPTVRRVTEEPLKVGTVISASTPAAAICPTCRIFEKQTGCELCPACLRRQAQRLVSDFRFRQHTQSVHEEVTGRRLDAIDPDWRERFADPEGGVDFRRAESFYRLELQKLS